MNKLLEREDELGVSVQDGLSPDEQISMIVEDLYADDKSGRHVDEEMVLMVSLVRPAMQ